MKLFIVTMLWMLCDIHISSINKKMSMIISSGFRASNYLAFVSICSCFFFICLILSFLSIHLRMGDLYSGRICRCQAPIKGHENGLIWC